MCVLIFSTTFAWNISHSRINERDLTIKYISPRATCPLFLSGFNETYKFVDIFSKNAQISNFIKIYPLGAELFQRSYKNDKDNSGSL